MEKVIYRGIFGSHLFGTAVPTSDQDFKQVHKDSLESIVLRKSRDVFDQNTNNSGRNTSADVDFESKELRTFIRDALMGQTYAFDLLFTPKHQWLEFDKVWLKILKNREKLLTNNVMPFIGYVRNMSLTYSKKGEKLKILRTILDTIQADGNLRQTASEFFDKHPELLQLQYVKTYKKHLKSQPKKVDTVNYEGVISFDVESDNATEVYFDVVKSSFPGNRKLGEVFNAISGQADGYGERVNQAMVDGGIDLKAYYHALRIAWELEEYLTTRKITLPAPRAPELLKVRRGEYSKEYVEEFITQEVDRVLQIPNNLPSPDFDFWDDFIVSVYIPRRRKTNSEISVLLNTK